MWTMEMDGFVSNSSSDSIDCDYLFNHDKCVYSKECISADGYIPYAEIFYCHDMPSFLFFIFSFIWLLIIFQFLGSVSSDYFCGALMKLTAVLKLSPNMAGVTLLALGNGAPDIFSSIAAIESGIFAQAFGELMGAAVFVSTVVVGTVALCSSVEVKPTRRPFLRDILFFLFGLVLVWYIMLDRLVVFYESISLILYYFTYVLVVFVGRLIFQKRKKMRRLKREQEAGPVMSHSEKKKVNETSPLITEDTHQFNPEDPQESTQSPQIPSSQPIPIEGHRLLEAPTSVISTSLPDFSFLTRHPHLEKFDNKADSSEMPQEKAPQTRRLHSRSMVFRRPSLPPSSAHYTTDDVFLPRMRATYTVDHEFSPLKPRIQAQQSSIAEATGPLLASAGISINLPPPSNLETDSESEFGIFDWSNKNILEKVIFILLFPINIAVMMTVPSVDHYSRIFATLQPTVIPLFLFLIYVWIPQGGISESIDISVAIILGLGILTSIGIFFLLQRYPHRPPTIFSGISTFVALCMSSLWIYLWANELVALLESLGLILGISNAILGLTVLAWGNSIGDWISNTLMGRKGFPGMAIGASYAAPLCNMLLGLGISLTWLTFKTQAGFRIDSAGMDNSIIIGIVVLLFTLVSTLVVVPLCRFLYTRPFAIVLIIFYFVFTALGLLSEFGGVFNGSLFLWITY